MKDLDRIKETTGLSECYCTCNKCVDMCKAAPCIGTPQEILTLINNGYADKLEFTTNHAVKHWGEEPIQMITPKQLENGNCAFLDENNLCRLHDIGLKPSEGVLANCNPKYATIIGIPLAQQITTPLHLAVALTWTNNNNLPNVFRVFKAMVTIKGIKQ